MVTGTVHAWYGTCVGLHVEKFGGHPIWSLESLEVWRRDQVVFPLDGEDCIRGWQMQKALCMRSVENALARCCCRCVSHPHWPAAQRGQALTAKRHDVLAQLVAETNAKRLK